MKLESYIYFSPYIAGKKNAISTQKKNQKNFKNLKEESKFKTFKKCKNFFL